MTLMASLKLSRYVSRLKYLLVFKPKVSDFFYPHLRKFVYISKINVSLWFNFQNIFFFVFLSISLVQHSFLRTSKYIFMCVYFQLENNYFLTFRETHTDYSFLEFFFFFSMCHSQWIFKVFQKFIIYLKTVRYFFHFSSGYSPHHSSAKTPFGKQNVYVYVRLWKWSSRWFLENKKNYSEMRTSRKSAAPLG